MVHKIACVEQKMTNFAPRFYKTRCESRLHLRKERILSIRFALALHLR